jgi:hypothetical protein
MPFPLATAFSRRRFVAPFAATAVAFPASAAIGFVNRRPSAACCFLLAHAAFLVTARDLLGFAFLFPGVFLFAPSGHKSLLFFIHRNALGRPTGFVFANG